MLRESENFFFHLMARPETIFQLRKDRARTLKRFFRSEKDREALMRVPLERLETYRRHVSVGLLGGIESAFPVIRSLVTQEEWNGLLNDFYLKRLTRSPIARHVFREFSNYLQKRYRGHLLKRMPYLKELAEYENLDLLLVYDVDRPLETGLVRETPSSAEEFLKFVPVLNPHHALRVYRWPVHRICRGYSTPKQVKPSRFTLLIYRDPDTLRVRFLEATPLVAGLVSRMESGKTPVSTVLQDLIRRYRPRDPAGFVRDAVAAIGILKNKSVVVGFKKSAKT
jgi:uncharacterized protein